MLPLGRIAVALAATAVVAVQTTLTPLPQVILDDDALFHTSLYLTGMQAFLDDAEAPRTHDDTPVWDTVGTVGMREAVLRGFARVGAR
ncbi:hypothetical protein [Streptomyces sp. NPDC056194]|uniref:hypothetical protein n=1 Tax=unclassified Streptomyces TaxID=2593676 RepID=UPI0035DE068D